MKKLVECVPNFSEGRDGAVLDAIAQAVRNTPGCTLLDVDPGRSTNRTVFTFVGPPEAVVEGALAAARVAQKRIDMTLHSGEHPRMGAMDVCPFVPVSGVTMDECVECARSFGRRAAEELGIPIFLYEDAATEAHRKSLKQIRAGEYEGLADKLQKPEWKPDFGPAELVPSWGATATGARFFLIAYNVNVLGTKEQAHRIALNVREQGRGEGQPGRLKEVKGIGWWVDEYGMAQVSMNLDNYRVTPPHVAFEACDEEAASFKLAVAGSELVGLIPLEAILMAADHYIEKEQLFILEQSQKVRLVVDRLGLGSITPFVPEKRIIEYMLEDEDGDALARLSVREFVESVGARTSAPGGGSVSALVAALGAALGAMVGWMTYGRRHWDAQDSAMRRLIPPLHDAMKRLIPTIDADTNAFEAYMTALRLPQETEAQRTIRHAAMQEGLKQAVEVPLSVMRLADRCWEAMVEMADQGNMASRSDLEVGAKALETGVWGAYRNVLVNLADVEDEAFIAQVRRETDELVGRARGLLDRVLQNLAARE